MLDASDQGSIVVDSTTNDDTLQEKGSQGSNSTNDDDSNDQRFPENRYSQTYSNVNAYAYQQAAAMTPMYQYAAAFWAQYQNQQAWLNYYRQNTPRPSTSDQLQPTNAVQEWSAYYKYEEYFRQRHEEMPPPRSPNSPSVPNDGDGSLPENLVIAERSYESTLPRYDYQEVSRPSTYASAQREFIQPVKSFDYNPVSELLRMRSPEQPERRHGDLGDLYFNQRRTSDISPPRPSWRHSSSEKNIASESERGRQIVKDEFETRRRKRSLSGEKSVHSNEINESLHSASKQMKIVEEKIAIPNNFVMIDDLLLPPGRDVRPEKICVILRGPPGSGKSYVAKLIRDKEVEMGGQVRILSIDDYFLHEQQIEEKDPSGKTVKSVYMQYEYDKNLEEKYENSLQRSFMKNISDGFYSFLIYDAVNAKPDNLLNLLNHAKQFNFQVYLCLLELDPYVCHSRNIHNRSLQDIKEICEAFVPNPTHYKQLDVTTLLQNDCINDVHMEDAM